MFRVGLHWRALDLKFEQSSGTQHAVNFTHIVLDDLAARYMLEHDYREGEIELQWLTGFRSGPTNAASRRKILAVV